MPFRQLKSFLKILIGVQYKIPEIVCRGGHWPPAFFRNLCFTHVIRESSYKVTGAGAPRLPCVKGAGSRISRKRETEGLSNLHSQGVPGKRKVLIPSVMALRETAMTAPLGQQGEPLGNGLPLAIIHILIRCAERHPWSARVAPGGQWPPLQVAIPDFIIDYVPSVPRARAATAWARAFAAR